MCYFQVVRFELYPESPKMPADYWLDGETEAQHRARMRQLRRMRAAQNAADNGKFRAAPGSSKIAAERP